MSQSVRLFYFSGTGNSQFVTETLEHHFKQLKVDVSTVSIEDVINSSDIIKTEGYDMIGLCFPIYGLGIPSIVTDFIEKLQTGEQRRVFLYLTGADFISLNYNAFDLTTRLLKKSNYHVFYHRIIVMPSNWVVAYPDTFNKQLIDSAKKKTEHMCHEVLEHKERICKSHGFIRYFSKSLYWLEHTFGSRYFGLSLKADESCNHCNICVKNCPVKNIEWRGERLKFGNKCLFCMRCIYNCPQKAIKSRGYNFTILKDGYDIRKTLEDETIGNSFITPQTKGYFKHFLRYINNIEV